MMDGGVEKDKHQVDVMGWMKWVTLHSSSFCLSAAVAFYISLTFGPLGF